MKGTNNGHRGNAVKHIGLFFRKVVYSSYDAPPKMRDLRLPIVSS